MPKTKNKNTYVVDGKRYDAFEKAAARAVDLSLQTESQEVTIVEHGQTGTYNIVVRAEAEQVG
jgi:hypothetical protein